MIAPPNSPAAPGITPLFQVTFAPTDEEFIEVSLLPFRAKRRRNLLLYLTGASAMIAVGLWQWESMSWAFYIGASLLAVALLAPFGSRALLREFFEKHPQFGGENVITIADEGVLD